MLTNLFPVTVKSEEFKIRRFAYSEEKLSNLRQTFNATHSFFRSGENIYASWMDGSDITGGDIVTITSSKQPEVVASLIRHVFFRTFRRQVPNLVPLEFYPLRFVSRKVEHDAAYPHLPDNLKRVLSFQRLIEVQLREIAIPNTPSFVLVVNSSRRWYLNRTLEDLRKEGYSLVGKNVLHSQTIQGLERVLAPSENLVGTILELDGDVAVVDTNEGHQRLAMKDLFLSRSRTNIEDYLEFKVGEQAASRILSAVKETTILEHRANEIFTEISEYADYFSKWGFYNNQGFEFSVEKLSNLPAHQFVLEQPTFIFNPNPGFAAESIAKGLWNYGPYDSGSFTPKSPRILVICHKSNRAAFSQLFGNLINGVPESPYYKKGFKALYRLYDVSHEFCEVADFSSVAFEQAVKASLDANFDRPFDLALIEGVDAEENSPQNPYLRAKALLMGAGIPVQAIRGWRARLPKQNLFNIYAPLALQMYAKMGGIPWVLPASGDVDRELVIGIGSTMVRNNNFAGNQQKRIVGFTTFFSSDGRFLLSSKCKEVDYEGYF